MTLTPSDLKFDANGLLPVVVQHAETGQVLMLGFANQEAVERTLADRRAWFYSRSRGKLWLKGETSDHFLDLQGLRVDCDGDALIYQCLPSGPTCHTNAPSCFFQELESASPVETDGEAAGELWSTIKERQSSGDTDGSYVAKLLAQGVDRIGKKVGEEAAEVIIAAKNRDKAELAHEVADLWFHTFVLLAEQDMTPSDIWAELRSRRK